MQYFKVIVAISGVALFGALGGCSPPTAEQYAERIDRDSEKDMALKALRETDPEFYAVIRGRASGRLASGMPSAEVLTLLRTEVRNYTLREAPNVAAAPRAELMRVVETERDLIRHLQGSDVQACADFAMRGLSPGYRPSGEGMDLVNEAARARLIAAKAGRDAPVRRGEVTEADGQAMFAAMAATGLAEDSANALFNGSLPTKSTRVQCDTTATFYDVMLDLPPERGERVAGVVLRAAAEAAAAMQSEATAAAATPAPAA